VISTCHAEARRGYPLPPNPTLVSARSDAFRGRFSSTLVATRNLKLLEHFIADHRDVLGWIPPQGGMTAFPWLVSGENERPFCQAATERGILLAPGDCFNAPSHFRLGFAAAGRQFL
jgi:aspartate/methionine/tyrosine aminotransferase